MNVDISSLFSAFAVNASVSSQVTPAAPDPGRDHGHGPRVQRARNDHHHRPERGPELDDDRAKRSESAPSTQQQAYTAVEYRRAERTKLQIRTQEGDIVTLKFSARDALEAESNIVGDDETLVTELDVRATSTTRLRIAVEGDLNPDELAAIQNIVEHAGTLAEQFFAGGAAEAAALVGDFDFDTDQLARVRLKLSLREQLTYSQIATPLATPTTSRVNGPGDVTRSAAAPVTSQALQATQAPQATQSNALGEEPAIAPSEPTGVARSQALAAAPGVSVPPSAAPGDLTPSFASLIEAIETIAIFLTDLLNGLTTLSEPAKSTESSPSESDFSVSFKLRVFHSILVATGEATDTPKPALPPIVDEALETLAAEREPGLDEAA